VLKFSKKGSNLIVIFILTAIVSGCILTYLSISHISNYRELLEKKISEEERELTRRFASGFQNNLDSLTLNFFNYVQNNASQNLENLNKFNSENRPINYVVIDATGSYLIPNFSNSDKPLNQSNSTTIFTNKLRKAENTEFILKDYKSATSLYLLTLKVAGTKSDSAHVYNSVARLYLKMDLQQKALETYQTLLSNFSSTLNSSGFPYAYFSIVKLLKMSDSSNIEQVRELLYIFLNELSNGTIPLNESSEEILELILSWQHKFSATSEDLPLEKLIAFNKSSLLLIKNYKIPIEKILKEENIEFSKAPPIDYLSVKPTSGSTEEIMLFYTNKIYSFGFTIGLKQLFGRTLQGQQFNDLKFEYVIKLVEKTANNLFLHTNLITLTEFSTLFEDCFIQVALKNKNIIEETVFKRKITYGIGLFLFLGITIFGLYLLIQDIKREKRINKLRTDFVSNVTHELKTPLTSINMFAEALNMNKDTLDTRQKKYTNIIVKESEKLKRIINNILEFSKKENNKLSYNLEASNLTTIVNSTLHEMDYFLEINNFDVHSIIENNVFANVYPEGIKLALTNLISNALKYAPVNKKLNIRLFKEASKIYIEVEDFGIGIPKDELELIFEKFYRVNSSENETTSGTGLGLTVTKDIIEEQGGKLLVESKLGKGSKFTIVLNTI
jgi:signal transduction histidine kinase